MHENIPKVYTTISIKIFRIENVQQKIMATVAKGVPLPD
jgi:hypothetical protein